MSALSRVISSVPVFVVLLDPKGAVIPVIALAREKDFPRVYSITGVSLCTVLSIPFPLINAVLFSTVFNPI